NEKYFFAACRTRRGQIYRRRSFADAAFLICDYDDHRSSESRGSEFPLQRASHHRKEIGISVNQLRPEFQAKTNRSTRASRQHSVQCPRLPRYLPAVSVPKDRAPSDGHKWDSPV